VILLKQEKRNVNSPSNSRFEDLATSSEVLFTGIKVIDLIEPYSKVEKNQLFGGAGVE
jgi:F0F1-type ATP synthase beta subunit